MIIRNISFWLFFLLAIPAGIFAQDQGEQISWDDEEETEMPEPKEQVSVFIDDEAIPVKEDNELEFEKEQIMDVKVRDLQPNSYVVVHVKKAGVKLEKESFMANELGELDLEIKTGKKKVGATAVVFYTASSGKKHEINARVKIR